MHQTPMFVESCAECAGGAIVRQKRSRARELQLRVYANALSSDVIFLAVSTALIECLLIALGLLVAFIDDRTFHIAWWAALNCLLLYLSIILAASISAHWPAMDPWVRGAMWLASMMACASACAGIIGAIFWGIWKLDSQQLVTGSTCTMLLNLVTIPMVILRVAHYQKTRNNVSMKWESEGVPFFAGLLPWWWGK